MTGTYKSIVVNEPNGPFSIVERPIPTPSDDQVLVKVLACGVCHSDNVTKAGLVPGIEYPRSPGHELIGDIVTVGSKVDKWTVGDRVGSGWIGHICGECDNCKNGEGTICEKTAITGIYFDGGYGEYAIVHHSSLVPISKDLDPATTAPLLCAGLTVYNGLRQVANGRKDELVAIQGIGGLGSLAIGFAKKLGYRVAALSTSDAKKELAFKLGADYYLTPNEGKQSEQLLKLGGAKILVSTSDPSEPIIDQIRAIKSGGTFLVISPLKELNIDSVALLMKRVNIVGINTGTPEDAAETIKFAGEHGIKPLIETYNGLDIDQVNAGFDSMMNGKARFRSVLVFA